jgi:MazG family protein
VERTKPNRCKGLEDIFYIIERLLGKSGCPWDRRQTPQTIQTYLIEESHEAAAAVRAGKVEDVAEELGDLLFMAFFLVHLYERRGDFGLGEVCRLISEKMVRRHPHVFGEMSVSSAKEVKDNWEKIKEAEKQESGKGASPVPDSLPALIRAHRILSRLSQKEDLDWNDVQNQGREFLKESTELEREIRDGLHVSADRLGRLFVRLANLARLQDYRAEDILHEFLKKLEFTPSRK